MDGGLHEICEASNMVPLIFPLRPFDSFFSSSCKDEMRFEGRFHSLDRRTCLLWPSPGPGLHYRGTRRLECDQPQQR